VNGTLTVEAFLDFVVIEIFFDDGITPMTSLFYPQEPYTVVQIRHHAQGNDKSQLRIRNGSSLQGMKSIFY
jgi:sucrose-6-phosphate hydrolase SacC (GH32 family)